MQPLWSPTPERIESARLTAFIRAVEASERRTFSGYSDLHRWSVQDASSFWSHVWSFCGVIGDRGSRVIDNAGRMPGARFFPDSRVNFAENLLRRSDEEPAIIATTEEGRSRELSFSELRRQVAQAARALRRAGVGPGDRVCGVVANVPETVVATLAAAAIGAVWSSCSPDFGVDNICDRFGQIAPTVLIATDAYFYAGKRFECLQKLSAVSGRLPALREVVIVSMGDDRAEWAGPVRATAWDEWLERESADPLELERFDFNHPLYILFTSGTTGVPKSIVHGAGGTLIEHLKEHQLQTDIRRSDRIFYYSTCGWMMWNWLVTALASEATLILYDGSAVHPDRNRLFDLADASGTTMFGVSARYIDTIRKSGLRPIETHRLDSVRTISSTGSPLGAESFDYVYTSIKRDVQLASVSGGTDIVGCFVGGNPVAPVWRGEIQAAGLGLDVRVFDEDGRAVSEAPGELVCASPFPSMPLCFWNDAGDQLYRATYFSRFPGVWHHGDWLERTPRGGFVIHGRSDATLNPGGVRIGTAELYRQVAEVPEVIESLAVAQRWDGSERIVLFVRLAPNGNLDDELRDRIRTRVRTYASPRHVPSRIIQVADIPRTRNGKIAELAVRRAIHGEPVPNRDALENPGALDLYHDLPDLRS